jgi:hypothetical protein
MSIHQIQGLNQLHITFPSKLYKTQFFLLLILYHNNWEHHSVVYLIRWEMNILKMLSYYILYIMYYKRCADFVSKNRKRGSVQSMVSFDLMFKGFDLM